MYDHRTLLCGKDVLMRRQDSLQAFSSSIAGMLSSRAVLEGTFLPVI
jgi:hypothetical protein